MGKKYVVIVEGNDGYMDCVGIEDSKAAAYGRAYLWLSMDAPSDKLFVTTPETREGERGVVISLIGKETGHSMFSATILTYNEEEGDEWCRDEEG